MRRMPSLPTTKHSDTDQKGPAMEHRTFDGFWFVWHEGMDWPDKFGSEQMAKDRARRLASESLGRTVHVCKLQSVGTLMIPHNPSASGIMAGAAD